MIQTSCSELLIDTQLHDVNIAYIQLSKLFKKFGLEVNPKLSAELLRKIQNQSKKEYSGSHTEVIVFDKLGNRCWLEYGDNGYMQTGFRLDTHCNQGDEKCFLIFKIALDNLANSELYSCDGGDTVCYEEWEKNKC